jgi:hypothetical protein
LRTVSLGDNDFGSTETANAKNISISFETFFLNLKAKSTLKIH